MSRRIKLTNGDDTLIVTTPDKSEHHFHINAKAGNDVIEVALKQPEPFTSRNVLIGGLGNDTLITGPGDDVLTGGSDDSTKGLTAILARHPNYNPGNDTFIITQGHGYDLITDFHAGDNLTFEGVDPDSLVFGTYFGRSSHWADGAGNNQWHTTITDPSGVVVDLIGVQAHSLSDLNG